MSIYQTTVEIPETTYQGETIAVLLTVRDMQGNHVLKEGVPFTVHPVNDHHEADDSIAQGLAERHSEIDETTQIVVSSFYQANIPPTVFASVSDLPARFLVRFQVPHETGQDIAEQRFSVENPNTLPYSD